MRYVLASFFTLLVFWAATAAADVAVPPLSARVTDLTGTLTTDQRTALDDKLHAIETASGAQVAVLLVPTTQPETIEQYSMRVAEAWKLGRKGVDDGLLLLVAKDDHRVRVEVGYGLEGVIPDAVAKRVIDETITPRFKLGDFAGGIDAGVERLGALIEGNSRAGRPVQPESAAPSPLPANAVQLGSTESSVIDLTGTLPFEQLDALSKNLRDFYDSGRTKPAFVLVVPTTRPEPIRVYAARMLKDWGTQYNLDVDRSIVLVIARDDKTAAIEAGAGLGARILPGAIERAIGDIEPRLRKGDLAGATDSGVRELEKIIDGAMNNKTFGERVSDTVTKLPVWLLILLAAIGTAFRWFLGPFFGALVMAALVSGGAWLATEEVAATIVSGAVAFIFVLVGMLNWTTMALSSGSGGSGGGGFSGGGGGFGGGGASGSW